MNKYKKNAFFMGFLLINLFFSCKDGGLPPIYIVGVCERQRVCGSLEQKRKEKIEKGFSLYHNVPSSRFISRVTNVKGKIE